MKTTIPFIFLISAFFFLSCDTKQPIEKTSIENKMDTIDRNKNFLFKFKIPMSDFEKQSKAFSDLQINSKNKFVINFDELRKIIDSSDQNSEAQFFYLADDNDSLLIGMKIDSKKHVLDNGIFKIIDATEFDSLQGNYTKKGGIQEVIQTKTHKITNYVTYSCSTIQKYLAVMNSIAQTSSLKISNLNFNMILLAEQADTTRNNRITFAVNTDLVTGDPLLMTAYDAGDLRP